MAARGLGEALIREISGRSPRGQINDFGDALRYLTAGKSTSEAARDLGVPRSTLRGWLSGRTPRSGGGDLVDEARREQRRDRLSEGRENRLRETGLGGLTAQGNLYASEMDEGSREIDLGDYMDDVADELLDAYLDGADADELGDIAARAINDGGFYAHSFDPDVDALSWEITSVDGWA